MNRRRSSRLLGFGFLIVCLAVLGSILVPPIVLRDAAAPDRLAPYVDAARTSVGQNIEGLTPVHLRYVDARCREGGGAVLIFEQWQPPYLGHRYGYAMTGAWPPSGWGGGTSLDDLTNDPEITFFLGPNEVDCG